MSDLPDWMQRMHEQAVASAWLDDPYKVKENASPEEEALRAQQYLAAQSFHIRKALERLVAVIGENRKP